MHINLKALLHLSKSLSPNEKIQRQKCIECGKKSFLVRYELTGSEIITIKQIKSIKKTTNLPRRKPKTKNKKAIKAIECYKLLSKQLKQTSSVSSMSQECQTEDEFTKDQTIEATSLVVCRTFTSIQTEVKCQVKDQANQTTKILTTDQLNQTNSVTILSNQSIQTTLRECRHAKCDTEDLILSYSREQQTKILHFQSTPSQTDYYSLGVKWTQTQVECKENSMQTMVNQFNVDIQTDPHNLTAWTQTEVSNGHSWTQTHEMVEMSSRPHDEVLTLILTSLKGQSDLLQSGILDALNHLTELTLLSLKREQDQSKDFFGLIVDIPPEGKDMLPKQNERKTFSLRKHRTWKCSLKCRACGLHKHRILPETHCQGTQTKGVRTPTKVVSEIATQTDKKPKTHWILAGCW